MKLERLVISCGGTGGHFYPGLSIAREFSRTGGKPLLLIGGKHADAQVGIAQKYNIDAEKINAVPIPGNPFKMPAFLWATYSSIDHCRSIFRKFDPQAVLAMGCFASIPPALAAKKSNLPLFLHDGNAKIGKANKFFSRFAKKLALSFPTVNANLARCETVITGLPLRQEIADSKFTKIDAVAEINRRHAQNFTPDNPVLLVFGGSLGAASINKNFKLNPEIPSLDKLQIIHLTGPGRIEEVRENYRNFPGTILLLESSPDMELLYSASDMVVSRSGGSTVSELAFFGKYAILIPFPFAAERHQDDNARWLTDAGGAVLMDDFECSPVKFSEIVSGWLADLDTFSRKGLLSKTIAYPDASMNVIRMIDESI